MEYFFLYLKIGMWIFGGILFLSAVLGFGGFILEVMGFGKDKGDWRR